MMFQGYLERGFLAEDGDIETRIKAKIECVMSTLFSHAVRWEFCGYNPISSAIPVGTGGKRGSSTGVRISAKRQRSPLVLSSEQVKTGVSGSVASVFVWDRSRMGPFSFGAYRPLTSPDLPDARVASA